MAGANSTSRSRSCPASSSAFIAAMTTSRSFLSSVDALSRANEKLPLARHHHLSVFEQSLVGHRPSSPFLSGAMVLPRGLLYQVSYERHPAKLQVTLSSGHEDPQGN
eukprot:3835531-Amphidinium_carterae.1